MLYIFYLYAWMTWIISLLSKKQKNIFLKWAFPLTFNDFSYIIVIKVKSRTWGEE